MTFQDYFPIWNKLQTDQQDRIRSNLNFRTVKKGTILHNGDMDCTGLLLVKAGQLRAYILSDEGREITIYRLFDRDLCLFSASCIMRSIQFEVTIQAEKDTDLWVIPAEVYQDIMETSAPVANYTNELMASRFSEVMWLMEQVMWKSLDKRVAAFLLEEASIEGSSVLKTGCGSCRIEPRDTARSCAAVPCFADQLCHGAHGAVDTPAAGLEQHHGD